ncbi:glutathione S-transferase [Herbaspirillum sp. Sphag1AN]|uniref:glutathione S-transferase n=1 Tax=unclassified Herbaspirillum TaxID=2624150 RepID=UPI001609F31C|nr:glutathione S-transferase [Herbaspirillum sp. Sphag1AN]MBB3247717.1 glutathione S-transferase [Herbaspirillum sp. Sphag64]
MQLIGMLDSPYVRRVAISLQLLGLPFTHESVSVFRGFDRFRSINPVVKAPSLICEDGSVLMDSILILEYAEAHADKTRSLVPADLPGLRHSLYLIGLAMAANEKSVQIVYEQKLRPADKLHQPWLSRITGQLSAAYDALEVEFAKRRETVTSENIDQATVSTAVAWNFTREMLPELVSEQTYPALAALSKVAEALPEFKAAPFGDGTYVSR